MKKTIYFVAAAMICHSTTVFSQAKFSVTGGTSIANLLMREDGETNMLKNKIGLTAGAQIDIPAGTHFSVQTGLNFVQKGTRDKDHLMGQDYKYRVNLNYLELPLNLLYNTNHKSGNFFAGTGPTLAYGINGKYEMEIGTQKEEEKIHFGKGVDEARPFDVGINVITGYRFSNGIFAAVNYNHGLTNLNRDTSPGYDEKLTTRYFGVRLGYQFGRKK